MRLTYPLIQVGQTPGISGASDQELHPTGRPLQPQRLLNQGNRRPPTSSASRRCLCQAINTAGCQANDAPRRPLAQIEYTTVLIPCSVERLRHITIMAPVCREFRASIHMDQWRQIQPQRIRSPGLMRKVSDNRDTSLPLILDLEQYIVR